jgi:hypothetical protein
MARKMDAELGALRDGRMTEDEFVRATGDQWDAIAARIVRRWEIPPAIDAEDARQEMLLALVEKGLVGKWDPARDVSLARFVVWTTCANAKAWLHQQRGALRHRGKARSRFPLSEAACARHRRDSDGAEGEERGPVAGARGLGSDPESVAGAREVVSAVLALAPTRRVRVALETLLAAGGSVRLAADLLEREPELALACGVGSAREARSCVREAIAVAREMARAA